MIEFISIIPGDKFLCVNDKADTPGRNLLIRQGEMYTLAKYYDDVMTGYAVIEVREIPGKRYKFERFKGVK